MRAVWNGQVLAESQDTAELDGAVYFPRGSVRMEMLSKTDHVSVCGWKGKASYYTAEAGGRTNENCAWCYEDPSEEARAIAGMIAFWKGVKVES